MKTKYNRTNWVDNSTPINAENLNNIERGIEGLYSGALSLSDLIQGPGIKISDTSDGINVSLNFKRVIEAPQYSTSEGNPGDYYIDEINDYLYFCISNNPNRWIKIKLEKF